MSFFIKIYSIVIIQRLVLEQLYYICTKDNKPWAEKVFVAHLIFNLVSSINLPFTSLSLRIRNG